MIFPCRLGKDISALPIRASISLFFVPAAGPRITYGGKSVDCYQDVSIDSPEKPGSVVDKVRGDAIGVGWYLWGWVVRPSTRPSM